MRIKPRSGHPRQLMRDESGVIAIIVALSISTFLLGFAALAVDMGSAYVRKAELKSLADKLAIAGADGLPTIAQARTALVTALGSSSTGLCAGTDLPGVCQGADPNWEFDSRTDNGEITFYDDQGQSGELADRNGDGNLTLADQLSPGAAQGIGINVLLPPSRIPFGFASALGIDSANIQESATARIGTALGSGILPFALKPEDLTVGQFCVTDPTAVGLPVPVPAPRGLVFLTTANPSVIEGDTLTFTLFGNPPRGTLRVHFETDTDPRGVPATATAVPGVYTVVVPEGDPGSVVRVWVTGRLLFGGSFVSTTDTIHYPGTASTDLCSLPQAARGYVKLARSTVGNTLEQNIRSGPQVKLYPTGGLLGTAGTALGCLGDTLASPPSTTCLATEPSTPFSTSMTNGFFTSSGGEPGRLDGDCGGGTTSPHGFGGVDAMQLFDLSSPLVDNSFGSALELKNSLTNTTVSPTKGWIRSRALKCPRLAVMPIQDADSLTTVVNGHNITGFTYVWIDDGSSGRGLRWNGNKLRSFRGYVVDPKFLPDLVSGSPVIGPYLGGTMPKEALLIPNLPTP